MVAIGLVLIFDVITQPGRITEDFRSFYLAGWATRLGLPIYDPASLREIGAILGVALPIHPYLYPPPLAYAAAGLAHLTPAAAQIVWWAVGLGLITPALTLLAVRIAARGEGPRAEYALPELCLTFLLGGFLLWMFNIRSNMWWGQVNPIVVGLIALAVRFHLKKNGAACGALLAGAALIKMTPALLLLYFCADRSLRLPVLKGFAATVAAVFVATLPFGGASAWLAFLDQLPRMSHGSFIPGLFPASSPANFSFAGFFSRLAGDETLAMKVLTYASILALLAPILLQLWRTRRDPAGNFLLFAPLSVVMVLGSPLAYAHHVIYLLPGSLLQLAFAVRSGRVRYAASLPALYALISIDFPAYYHLFHFNPAREHLFNSMNLYGLVALYCVGMGLARSAVAERTVAAPADSERSLQAVAASP
jgi:alpha-1,2-mannosyltransferase